MVLDGLDGHALPEGGAVVELQTENTEAVRGQLYLQPGHPCQTGRGGQQQRGACSGTWWMVSSEIIEYIYNFL